MSPEEKAILTDVTEQESLAPYSIEAEQALLGSIMLNNRHYDDLQGNLEAEHFYVPFHAAAFEAMATLVNKGREASPITIREYLKNTPFASETELFEHLAEMLEKTSYTNDIHSLSEVIHTCYLQRQMMQIGAQMANEAPKYTKNEETLAYMDDVSSHLFELTETGTSKTFFNLRDPLKEVLKRAEMAKSNKSHIIGVTSGLKDLDRKIGGFQNSDLIILAARPSMGKTALAINVAYNAATALAKDNAHGAAVAVFSLEMSSDQLAARILCSAAGIDSYNLMTGNLKDDEFGRLTAAAHKLSDLKLYIDDTPQLSVNAIRSRARRMKRQHGIGMVVVDYLQLMRGSSKASQQNRVQEISEISQGLKSIARELKVPVLALSQLSRSVETRDNKRPQLSDLRESGSIEQDADIVMFLYREDYYLEKQMGTEAMSKGDGKQSKDMERLEQVRGITELLISKNRKGATATINLQFQPNTTTFHDYIDNRYDAT